MGTITNFVAAQNQPYFRVGDTIRGRDSIYHYQWWSEQWLSDPTHHLNLKWSVEDTSVNPDLQYHPFNYFHYLDIYGNGVILRYCYTDQPLKIVGIASSCHVRRYGTIVDTQPLFSEYLELWDADTGRNAFNRLAQIEWDHTQPNRYMEINTSYAQFSNQLDCCEETPTPHTDYIPIKEFYFEKPITVCDSFYVGHTANSVPIANYGGVCSERIPTSYNGYYWVLRSIGFNHLWYYTPNCQWPLPDCLTPMHQYKFRHTVYTGNPYEESCDTDYYASRWQWGYSPDFMLDFPIIEIDSSFYDGPPQFECPAVQDFRIGTQDDNRVVLLWSSHTDQYQWEVSICAPGVPPDSGDIRTAYIPAMMLSDLDSGIHYNAYVRATCMHDSLLYSTWSDSLDLCICDTSQTAAIETSILDQLTFLMPNPASHQVQLMSSYGITRVEAFALNGTCMADHAVKGLSTTLDVSQWPAGMYIIIIRTPAGTVAKKLVVKK